MNPKLLYILLVIILYTLLGSLWLFLWKPTVVILPVIPHECLKVQFRKYYFNTKDEALIALLKNGGGEMGSDGENNNWAYLSYVPLACK